MREKEQEWRGEVIGGYIRDRLLVCRFLSLKLKDVTHVFTAPHGGCAEPSPLETVALHAEETRLSRGQCAGSVSIYEIMLFLSVDKHA